MAHLPSGVRAAGRFFAFFLGNGTLGYSSDTEIDFLEALAGDSGRGSALEMAFAIFLNVLEVDDAGVGTNSSLASRRASQYLRHYCDPTYEVVPPFEAWEKELAM